MGRGGKKFPDEFYFLFLHVPARKQKFHPLLAGRGEKKRKEERETLENNFSPNKGFILKAIDSRKVSALTFASLISYSSPKFDSFGR